ncbi:MAG: Histidine kinase [Microgenomates group bacterium GW2011_GWA2_47_8]|nr:MAG: Histidine kinase [Microgenomates group bacterium GW2011_GWA2_47_8]
MFKAARVKLTLWYLLIIMTVSVAFSTIIYRASVFELKRFATAQQNRFERKMTPFAPMTIDDELMLEALARIRYSLLMINMGILVVAGGLGYYLSGKTLFPISEMVKEQDRFVSDASHELKTPITAIKTMLEVTIRDPKLSVKEAKTTLIASLEEVNRLQKLAEGLLELTYKRVIGKMIPVNLKEVVIESIKLMEPTMAKKQIKLDVKVPKVIVEADSASLGRAIVAIVDNAVKYSSTKSRIKINSKVDNRMIVLSVRDYGVGIQKDEISKVFDRFYRSERSRHTSGYGLGLAITQKIVQAHGGKIAVKSKIGIGTTVSIVLPYSVKLQNTRLG